MSLGVFRDFLNGLGFFRRFFFCFMEASIFFMFFRDLKKVIFLFFSV